MDPIAEPLPPSRSSRRRTRPPESQEQEPSAAPLPQAADSSLPPLPVAEVLPVPAPVRKIFAGSTLAQFDVVQVTKIGERTYGLFIIVGDVLRGKVHGFHFVGEGGKKEFITVDEDSVHLIGSSKVRSKTPCSPKWVADNRPS